MGTSREDRLLVGFGVACLVVSSLCDSVRAPALPLLARGFSVGYGALSSFLSAGSLGSLAFNLLALRALGGVSDRGVVALAAGLQAAAMLAAAAAPGLGTLAAAGFVWGAGNVGLGLCANLLVIRGSAPQARARRLSLLHVFYGLSCVLPPLYVAAGDRAGWGAAALFAVPALLPAGLAAAAARLPGGHSEEPPGGAEGGDGLPWLLGGVIALYVLGEVMTSMWLVALLTSRGAALAEAGRTLSGFFLALAAARAAAAAWVRPGDERVLVPLGLAVGIAGTLLGAEGRRAGFWLAGAAFGPVFPLLMVRLSARPRGLRRALAFVYAAMVLALGAGHLAVGWLADVVSPRAAGYFAPACLAAGLAAWLRYAATAGFFRASRLSWAQRM